VQRSRASILVGLALVSLISLAALLAPWIAEDPNRVDLGSVLSPPSTAHWLGTDGLGRDVAARLVYGARVSLKIGFTTGILSVLIGLPIGALAGYVGGAVEGALSRLIEAALCFPALVITIALLSIGPPWLLALPETARIALALSVIGWTPAARYLRAEFRRLRGSESIASARAAGASHARIVWRHLLPQSLGPVLVTLAFGVGGAALAEATLSFVGVGISPPTASWGELLFEALHHVGDAWWLALFPGAALFLLLLGCNELAEGLRTRLDPRRHVT
jgi:peptide/nickel transport system permease protein